MKRTLIIAVLLNLGSTAVTAQPAAAPETITVSLSDFKFDPSQIQLQAGRSYILHFVNTASDTHEFTAKDFLKAARISPDSKSVAHHGEVELKGGQTADLKFVAPTAGRFDLHCGKPGHAEMGMTGAIIVQ